MNWQGESGVVADAKRDGWNRLDEVLDGHAEARRAPGNLHEIELCIVDPESGTEWDFARDEDGQWWGCGTRGQWHTSYGGDAHHAIAAIADQLADLKEEQAAELMSDARSFRGAARDLRTAEPAVA